MRIILAALAVALAAVPAVAYGEIVTEYDDRTYIFAGDGPVSVLDATPPNQPVLVAKIPGIADGIADMQVASVDGHRYLFAVTLNDDLHIVDVTEPYKPAAVSVLEDVVSNAQEVPLADLEVIHTGSGVHALLASPDKIQIVDVSDPEDPRLAGVASHWAFYALKDLLELEQYDVGDRTYILAAGPSSVQVADFTNPLGPYPTSVIRHGQYGFDAVTELVDVEISRSGSGTFALIVGADAVQVADVTDERYPKPVAVLRGDDYGFDGIIDADVISEGDSSYALILDGAGVHIVDISDPASPAPLQRYSIMESADPGMISGVKSGDRLWVVTTGAKIHVADITDPLAPVPAYLQAGMTLFGPTGVDTAVIDGRLYSVVASSAGNTVDIIDFTDPYNIEHVSSVSGGKHEYAGLYGPNDVKIASVADRTYALVPNARGSTLSILDITDPSTPVPVSVTGGIDTMFVPTSAAFAVVDSVPYALVSSFYCNCILAFDIADPQLPELVISMHDGQYGFEGLLGPLEMDTVVIDGSTYLLVASYYDEALQIIDITDIRRPVQAAALLASWTVDSGLNSIEHIRPLQPGRDGIYDIGGIMDIRAAEIGGGTYAVAVGAYTERITIIDISDPYSPALASSTVPDMAGFTGPTGDKRVDIVGAWERIYAVVTTNANNAVHIIDITNPSLPLAVSTVVSTEGEYEALSGPVDISAISTGAGTFAVVVNSIGDSLQVIDMSDPPSPTPGDSIVKGPNSVWQLLGTGIDAVDVDGRTYSLSAAYSQDMVRITDITDPSLPVPVYTIRDGHGGFEIGGPVGVETGVIHGKPYAMIAGLRDGVVQVVDMSDPANPDPVSVIRNGVNGFDAVSGVADVALAEIRGVPYAVMVSTTEDAFHVVYMQDPTTPLPFAKVSSNVFGLNLSFAEDVSIVEIDRRTYAIVSSFMEDNVQIIDITSPSKPVLTSVMRGGDAGLEILYAVSDSQAVTVGDRTLMVAASYRSDGFVVVDISNPSDPDPLFEVHGHDINSYMHKLESIDTFTVDGRTYVAAASLGDSIQVTEITDLDNPRRVALLGGFAPDDTAVYGVTDVRVVQVGSSLIALALTSDELVSLVVDLTDPSSPVALPNIPPVYVPAGS